MASIDHRIVEMKFQNGQFERGIKSTSSLLDKFKEKLQFKGARQGLDELSAASKGFSLAGIATGVDNISSKFSALGAIGFTVLQNLTNSAINFGKKMLGAVLDPLIEGGKKRALNIEQAKFMFKGLGMDVDKTMDSARTAVLGTAYGLDEAAKAASQFGASGLRAGDDMTSALRAISGVAAMTGSEYSDIADVFTAVAGNGRLMGTELLRLSGRGINAAATLAKSLGKSEEEVRKMVSKGEISFEIFYKAMDEAFGEHATKASETYTGSLSNLRAALARIGADVHTPKFEALRRIFNAMTPAIDEVHAALKPALKMFEDFTVKGADKVVAFFEGLNFDGLKINLKPIADSIANVFKGIASVIKPIKEAFVDIFPPATKHDIYKITNGIREFTKSLTLSSKSSENLKRTFRGLFAVVDIGWMVIKGLGQVLAEVFNAIFDGSGSVLNFTGNIGDFLVSVRDAIKAGDGFTNFFKGLGKVIAFPIKVIKRFIEILNGMFDSNVTEAAGSVADGITERFSPLQTLGKVLHSIWKGLGAIFKAVYEWVKPLAKAIGDFLGELGGQMSNALADMDFSTFLDLVNTGLLGGLVLMLRNFLGGGGWFEPIKEAISNLFGGGEDGIIATIKDTFGALTDTLSAMQANLKAGTLMKIAGAITMLTASVVALSLIDSGKLTKALTAIAVMFAQLGLAMVAFEKFAMTAGWAKMPFVAGAMVILSGAILVLSGAVAILAQQDWNGIAKGLVGVGGLLTSLALFTKFAAVNKGAIAQSAGLILLATAIRILGGAVKQFADLDWKGIGKGLTTLAGLFGLLAIFVNVTGNAKKVFSTASGLLVLAAAIKVYAGVIETMGNFSWEVIGKGLLTMAGALAVVAGAMWIMPPNMLLTAASLIIVAGALKVIGEVVQNLGGMTWGEVAKGLVTLAGALVIIAGAMYLMTGALPGAAALIVVAGALRILAPVLKLFAGMTWGEIAKGLTMLAGAFAVIGVAGLLLGPVVPLIVALSVAIGLLGVAVLAAGAGMALFAAGFTALAGATAAGTAVFIGTIRSMLDLIPYAIKKVGEGFVELIKVIGNNAKTMVESFVQIGMSILDAILKLTPKIIDVLIQLIWKLLTTLANNVYRFTDAGARIIIGFLNGLAKNMNGIVTAGTNVIVSFLRGIQNNQGRVIQEAWNTVIGFINAMTASINNNAPRLRTAGHNLAIAIINGMTGGLYKNVSYVVSAAKTVAKSALNAAKNALGIHSPSREFAELGMFADRGFAIGLDKNSHEVANSATAVGKTAIAKVKDVIKSIPDILDDDMSVNPVITPVVDLSSLKEGVSSANGMLNFDRMWDQASRTKQRANAISDSHADQKAFETERDDSSPTIQFYQTNNSPKALSAADIYRQTKNQLSAAKGV